MDALDGASETRIVSARDGACDRRRIPPASRDSAASRPTRVGRGRVCVAAALCLAAASVAPGQALGARADDRAPRFGKPVAHVEETCPARRVSPPCFESIQEAIDALVAAFPDGRRVVRIGVGRYEQQFESVQQQGSTHIVGEFPVPAILSEEAPVVIAAPPNGVADVNWRFAGPGSISSLTFVGEPFEPADVGMRFDGNLLTELNVSDVAVIGTLGAGVHAIEVAQTLGFVQFYDVRAVVQCANGVSDARSAVLHLNMPDGSFHQFHWFGGELQAWGAFHTVRGCATLEAMRSTRGDDRANTVFERLHMQAEGLSTMIELEGDGVFLDFANNHYRAAPIGRFVEVRGAGSSSGVRFHGESRPRAIVPSDWGNVVPEGAMTIFGDGDPAPLPCFPGRWTYLRHDGPPDAYDCTDFDVWTPR